ncbi:hypothetical protein PRIPAC_81359 [Pristionchus pacificus]|uniref:SET domain-containing protein n=1 Tax=Pristionchus pacificus TaxID=54126 RepID=A0A2A6CLF6_PRIPA|nr:hypothetical protein PRIPAC_81359 [Pristionchus pacificus]|eukprot:PDM79032.1 SET domain-containing protein [Pristionchus pacificus]
MYSNVRKTKTPHFTPCERCALSSTSSCASRTEAKAWNVNRRNTMNTSPQAKRKRGFKRSLLTDDEQENIRPEKKRPPRRSGNADLLAEMATGEGNDYAIFPDPSATIKTEDEDALVMPIERGIVPKDEGIKEDPRDKSPSRVNGVNDGRVMGRPLDDHMRYQLEKKACIVYPFPRHTLFTNDKRGANSRSFQSRSKGKKMLDLMLDGEVDGGGETNKKQEYVIDGVLFMDSESALVNWHGFKFPTWEQREIVKKKDVDYFKRRKILNKVFSNINVKENRSPLELKQLYPNMLLTQTEDFSQYVTNPGIVYVSGLLKREQQINDYIEEYYRKHFKTKGPTLLFVDATNFKSSSIPTFQYIAEVEETKDAKENIEAAIGGNRSCTCGDTCNLRENCCALKSVSKRASIKKNPIESGIIKEERKDDDSSSDDKDDLHGRGDEKSFDCVDVYECGDACLCTPTTCQQRVLQRGHGHILMIFRHHVKGWTVRAGNDIPKGTFVCEYTGQIMTEEEAARSDKKYHLGLDVRMKDKKMSHLVIDAHKKGNEGRFLSHSCEPSLFPQRIHFDIGGRPKRHVGLFASRHVKEGEELSFDYFPDVSDSEDFHKKTQRAKFTCRCGSKKCRETAYQKSRRMAIKQEY